MLSSAICPRCSSDSSDVCQRAPSECDGSASSADDAREAAVLGVGRAMRPLEVCTNPALAPGVGACTGAAATAAAAGTGAGTGEDLVGVSCVALLASALASAARPKGVGGALAGAGLLLAPAPLAICAAAGGGTFEAIACFAGC